MDISQQLTQVFQSFRMPALATDQFEQTGKAVLAEKFRKFINNNEPLRFVMLGYPMKSGNNRDKVIGKLPDMAEEVSIQNFSSFNNAVKQVYSPGVEINIVNDGYVFNDLLEITDNTVADYQEASTAMAFGSGSPMVWHNLIDFYHKEQSLSSMRTKLMDQHGITKEELSRRILMDADVNLLYRGMMHFMEEELAIKNYPSRNQLNKAAKILTREMMLRNEAYSNMVKNDFASYVRLSMHPSINNGAKYSFNLIPGNQRYSPWHCALLIKDGVVETIHRKDAEAAGHELVFRGGRPYNYQA